MSGKTIEEALRGASFSLREAGVDHPRDEAEFMLASISGLPRLTLFLERGCNLPAETAALYRDAVRRRCRGEPLAYISGVKEFYGLDFAVNCHVLVPRPETEGIVEAVLEWISVTGGTGTGPIDTVDLGTGSGNLAITLARLLPRARFRAVDRSPAALQIASSNAVRHAVQSRIQWHHGDYFKAFTGIEPWPRFNLVVSNPPYIKTSDLAELPASVRCYEPRLALDGGNDGLDGYRSLLRDLPAYAAKPCFMALEVGAGQAEAVTALCRELGFFRLLSQRLDYQGIPRVVTGLA
ncbi:MAG: peptide chain release factor N(5)-glutamine methyltransferase [Bacillota bacterium]